MIAYTTCNTLSELEGIFSLQKNNLPRSLTTDEIRDQGFVTVDHSFGLLEDLNNIEKHVIAKDGEKVIGYVLAMTKRSRLDVDVLVPMFEQFETVLYKGKPVIRYNFLIVGQVCIDKDYRGLGVFDQCYQKYREYYGKKYEFAATEIVAHNIRSRNAHKRIGFKEVYSYRGPDQMEWVIVIWDWRSGK